jgi:hypothetical protein
MRIEQPNKESVMQRVRESILVAASILLAAAARASVAPKETIRLDRAAMVGGTVLPAGIYGVDLSVGRDMATFVQGKSTVVEAPCKVGSAHVPYRANAAHVVTGVDGQARLVKIELASLGLAVEFPVEQSITADGPVAETAGGR